MEKKYLRCLKLKRVNDFIESVLKIISKESEVDPWGPKKETKEQVTEEEIEEAINQMQKPKKEGIHPVMVKIIQLFTLLWAILHFALLYVMLGSPISGGILLYVIINLSYFSHYFILLRKAQR